MSAPNDPTYDAAAAEAAAAAAIADATAAAADGAEAPPPPPPVPPSPIVPAAASAQVQAEVRPEGNSNPVIPADAPRYADADLHRHDVLSGRGGYVNAHPGNHHLRTLCHHRKAEWEAGSNATKRRIALEIYGMIRRLDPPGRFLKKEIVPGSGGGGGGGGAGGKGKQQAGQVAEEAETSATATAAAVAAEVIAGATTTTAAGGGDSAEASAAAAAAAIAAGDSETASAIMAPNVLAVAQAKAQQANAPWVELNEEKSIQKAMQVMRDYKRADRQDRDNKPGKRKRSNFPRGGGLGGLVDGGTGEGAVAVVGGGAGGASSSSAQANGYDEQMRQQHREAEAAADAYEANKDTVADAAAAAAGDAEVYAEGCTNGIVPTNSDVLTGRGAFINDHPGNKFWRSLAKQGKARFDAGDQTDKKEVATEIVRAVTNQSPTGGRFLRKIDPPPATGKKGKAARAFALTPRGFQGPWEVMDETEARVKTIQTLRDMGRDKSKNKKRRTSAPPAAAAAKSAPAASAAATASEAMPEMPPVGAAVQDPDYTKPLAEDLAHQQQQQMVTNPVIGGPEQASV